MHTHKIPLKLQIGEFLVKGEHIPFNKANFLVASPVFAKESFENANFFRSSPSIIKISADDDDDISVESVRNFADAIDGKEFSVDPKDYISLYRLADRYKFNELINELLSEKEMAGMLLRLINIKENESSFEIELKVSQNLGDAFSKYDKMLGEIKPSILYRIFILAQQEIPLIKSIFNNNENSGNNDHNNDANNPNNNENDPNNNENDHNNNVNINKIEKIKRNKFFFENEKHKENGFSDIENNESSHFSYAGIDSYKLFQIIKKNMIRNEEYLILFDFVDVSVFDEAQLIEVQSFCTENPNSVKIQLNSRIVNQMIYMVNRSETKKTIRKRSENFIQLMKSFTYKFDIYECENKIERISNKLQSFINIYKKQKEFQNNLEVISKKIMALVTECQEFNEQIDFIQKALLIEKKKNMVLEGEKKSAEECKKRLEKENVDLRERGIKLHSDIKVLILLYYSFHKVFFLELEYFIILFI